jgi:hypothetical protein
MRYTSTIKTTEAQLCTAQGLRVHGWIEHKIQHYQKKKKHPKKKNAIGVAPSRAGDPHSHSQNNINQRIS